jgi:hypothetical protein
MKADAITTGLKIFMGTPPDNRLALLLLYQVAIPGPPPSKVWQGKPQERQELDHDQ